MSEILVVEVFVVTIGIIWLSGKLFVEKLDRAEKEYDFNKAYEAYKEKESRFDATMTDNELNYWYDDYVKSDEGAKAIEAECLAVFATLPSWKNVKSWNPLYYDEYKASWIPHQYDKKRMKKIYGNLHMLHAKLARTIYFANRGKVAYGWGGMGGEAFWDYGEYTHADEESHIQMGKEIAIWHREKLKDYTDEDYLLILNRGNEVHAKKIEIFSPRQRGCSGDRFLWTGGIRFSEYKNAILDPDTPDGKPQKLSDYLARPKAERNQPLPNVIPAWVRMKDPSTDHVQYAKTYLEPPKAAPETKTEANSRMV